MRLDLENLKGRQNREISGFNGRRLAMLPALDGHFCPRAKPDVPVKTITDPARDDIMFVEEVIGTGEIAISDERSTNPQTYELARLVWRHAFSRRRR